MILYYRPTLNQQTESNLPNLSTNSISYSYSIDCSCLILFVSYKCINIIMISKTFILCVENKQVLKLFTIVLSYNKIMQFTGIAKCLIFYNLEIQPILKYSPNLKNLVESQRTFCYLNLRKLIITSCPLFFKDRLTVFVYLLSFLSTN